MKTKTLPTPNVTRTALILLAEHETAQYPQYRGYWNDFRLAIATRDVRTKMGTGALKGEWVLARVDPRHPDCVEFRSRRTKSNSIVLANRFQFA